MSEDIKKPVRTVRFAAEILMLAVTIVVAVWTYQERAAQDQERASYQQSFKILATYLASLDKYQGRIAHSSERLEALMSQVAAANIRKGNGYGARMRIRNLNAAIRKERRLRKKLRRKLQAIQNRKQPIIAATEDYVSSFEESIIGVNNIK